MKLDYVTMAGFRGFRDKVTIPFAPGFVVLCGRNGAGKSTVLDAIDFALTGTINKFSGSGSKTFADHIWWVGEGASEHYVTIGFVTNDGEKFSVTRSRETGSDSDPVELLARFCQPGISDALTCQAIVHTTLIRDELIASDSMDLPGQARFTALRDAIGVAVGANYLDRTASIFEAAKAQLQTQREKLADAQTSLGRALSQLTEARTEADRSSDVAAALNFIDVHAPSNNKRPRPEAARRAAATRRTFAARLKNALDIAGPLVGEIAYVQSNEYGIAISDARQRLEQATISVNEAREAISESEKFLGDLKSSDEAAVHLAGLLEHGRALGLRPNHDCPLCLASRTDDEWNAALASLELALSERGRKLAEASAAVKMANESYQVAMVRETIARNQVHDLEQRKTKAEQNTKFITQELSDTGQQSLAITNLSGIAAAIELQTALVTALENAALVVDASGAVERIAKLEGEIVVLRDHLEELAGKLVDAQRAHESARLISQAAQAVPNEVLMEQFDTVMPLLKELYRRLKPHLDWQEIDSDFGGRIRSTLNFLVGDGYNPQYLFSSGQRRAAGLAFLLAVHLSRPWCKWQSLLLDDPVQHIDDYRALHLVEVLSAIRRSGRQIVVAVEDSSLADLLCRRLRSTTAEGGRRFDIATLGGGVATSVAMRDILPFNRGALRVAS